MVREDLADSFVGNDLLIEVIDGFNAQSNITYKPLTDPSVYQKGTGASLLNGDNGLRYRYNTHGYLTTISETNSNKKIRVRYCLKNQLK